MAMPARKYEEENDYAPLRLIPGGKSRPESSARVAARPKRDARRQDARPFRRVFVVAVGLCAALVLLGFVPVFLSAQATRDSQQAVLIQESLDAANARSEQLEMRRSVLTSSSRINTIAATELGMVPSTGGQMTVELDTPKPRVAASPAKKVSKPTRTAQASVTQKSRAALHDLARLTAGQAGALLVGDVGLAATR